MAGECSSERLAVTLEGGYHVEGLRESVKAVLNELAGKSLLTANDLEAMANAVSPPVVDEVIQLQKTYWPTL
ncbi:MAG: histone deacetylase, partial [Deltaproteobacteria bacterium]|nr:histone deacetylase [Deltaproteobacteria bacterium]